MTRRFHLNDYAYKRQYGPYTFFVNVQTGKSLVFNNATTFSSVIERNPVDIDTALKRFQYEFAGNCPAGLEVDFEDFLNDLEENSVLRLDGKSNRVNEEVCGNKVKPEMEFPTPQDVLAEYFVAHPTLVNLQIDIASACTERCVHCYIPEYENVFLPIAQIKKVVDWFADQGGLLLSISGGECMLHPKFIEILEYCASRDLAIKVFSNLTVCSEEIMRALVATKARVQTSIYSMDSAVHDKITCVKGSYDKTMYWLNLLMANKVPCSIACPLMDLNFGGYRDVRRFCKQSELPLSMDHLIIAQVNGDKKNLTHRISLNETKQYLMDVASESVEENPEYFQRYFQSKCFSKTHEHDWEDKPICDICISSMALDAKGDFYPCTAFGGAVLGNCFRDSIDWVWNSSPETLRIRHLRGRHIKKCVGCENRPYCSICLCRNKNETGDMFSPAEHYCEVAKINRAIVEGYYSEARIS